MHRLFPALLALFALWSGTAIGKTKHSVPNSPAKSGKRRPAKRPAKRGERRSTQQAPTPERYREIQQALAAKGYLAGEANGKWGPDSVEALKRFQHEQSLGETGKLDSVSLIALGLGPKRTARANPQLSQ